MKRNKTVIAICLIAMLFLPPCQAGVAGEFARENISQPLGVPLNFSYDISEPCQQMWYLDGEVIYQNDSYTTYYLFTHAWENHSDVGVHNLTAVITDQAGNYNGTIWTVEVGTRFIVPNGTTAVNITTLSVATAPGELFNTTTIVSPGTAIEVSRLQFQGTSIGKKLVQPDSEGNYAGEWLINASNNTALIARFSANNSNNGTFLMGLYPNATIAEDEAGNSIPVNIVNAKMISSPRYDISGAGGKPDFVVNILDTTAWRQAYYYYIYYHIIICERCDCNKNGYPDMSDWALVASNFGKTIPTV